MLNIRVRFTSHEILVYNILSQPFGIQTLLNCYLIIILLNNGLKINAYCSNINRKSKVKCKFFCCKINQGNKYMSRGDPILLISRDRLIIWTHLPFPQMWRSTASNAARDTNLFNRVQILGLCPISGIISSKTFFHISDIYILYIKKVAYSLCVGIFNLVNFPFLVFIVLIFVYIYKDNPNNFVFYFNIKSKCLVYLCICCNNNAEKQVLCQKLCILIYIM